MNRSLTRFLILLQWVLSIASFAQLSEIESPEHVFLLLNVKNIGAQDIDAILTSETVFLNVMEVFELLHIKARPSVFADSISGFYIDENNSYLIDYPNRSVTLGSKVYPLSPQQFIRINSRLYLALEPWERIFGLETEFDFRSLSVDMTPDVDLPLIRQMQRQKLRKNLQYARTPQVDVHIPRNPSWLDGAFLDWSLANSVYKDKPSDQTLQAAVGAEIAGGDLELFTYQRSRSPSVSNQQRYRWRYVNNENPLLRQLYVGKLDIHTRTLIPRPMLGVHVTNSPSRYRHSFASVKLSDRTQPNWMVELYVNRVLVDFVKADASGYYEMNVPIGYGYTLVTLKFIGPWGEERSLERWIHIPYHFLPAGEWNYALTLARFMNPKEEPFYKLQTNIGLADWFTVGGGYEFSRMVPGGFAPFIDLSARIKDNIIISANKVDQVMESVNTSVSLSANTTLLGEFVRYNPAQKAIPTNNLQELKLSLFMPFNVGDYRSTMRLKYQRSMLPGYHINHWEWDISSYFWGANSHLSTFSYQTPGLDQYTVTRLELFFRTWRQFLLRPFYGYNWPKNQTLLYGISVERQFAHKGYFYLQMEKNRQNDALTAQVGIRYEFPYMLAGSGMSQFREQIVNTQFLRGSLGLDSKQKHVTYDHISSVGRAAITLSPFLDINANNIHDVNEPRVLGMDIELNGGRIEYCDADTLIRITGLEPYREYFLKVNTLGLENIAWKPRFTSMSVFTDPNAFKSVPLPVIVQAEIQGNVSIETLDGLKGKGGMTLYCRELGGDQLYQIKSDPYNGDIYYLGLKPGTFIVYPDPLQLKSLDLRSKPRYRIVRVRPSVEGEIIKGLNFVLDREPNWDEWLDRLQDEMEALNREIAEIETMSNDLFYAHKSDTLFQDLYNQALSLFMQRRYPEAHTLWQQILDEIPSHPLWVNCHYWIGECHHAQNAYRAAIDKFQTVLELNSTYKTDDALYMLGQCYFRIEQYKDSALYFKQLLDKHPTSEYIPNARHFLHAMQKNHQIW
ncbi:tetratricopeptide repeat protein [candidate division KSB1 bacterium]|nr:tetratricopeptide repeat protein [candidate division KSB1 bacterium]